MSESTIDVARLCAAWCHTCEDYKVVSEQVKIEPALSGVALRWHWIDIEDEADLVGDFDVETFPTIVVIDAVAVRFAGPLTPQPDTLRRLLRATVVEASWGTSWPTVTPEVQAFAVRLRGRVGPT